MKKGLLSVSFGSSYSPAVERAIVPMEADFAAAFPEFQVYRAFTSDQIREEIRKQGGQVPDNMVEAFAQMKVDGVEEVLVQPLHFTPGEEYRKVLELVGKMKEVGGFKRIALGRSLLHYNGQEGRPDDYREVAELVSKLLPDPDSNEGVVLMGHGSQEASNAAYELLALRIQRRWPWIQLATLKGGPSLASLLPRLKSDGYTKLHVIPFMWMAGNHAIDDMAGARENSWKSILEKEEIEVVCHMIGLGEQPEFRKLFVNRAREGWEKI